jgi:hypothetical protein
MSFRQNESESLGLTQPWESESRSNLDESHENYDEKQLHKNTL